MKKLFSALCILSLVGFLSHVGFASDVGKYGTKTEFLQSGYCVNFEAGAVSSHAGFIILQDNVFEIITPIAEKANLTCKEKIRESDSDIRSCSVINLSVYAINASPVHIPKGEISYITCKRLLYINPDVDRKWVWYNSIVTNS